MYAVIQVSHFRCEESKQKVFEGFRIILENADDISVARIFVKIDCAIGFKNRMFLFSGLRGHFVEHSENVANTAFLSLGSIRESKSLHSEAFIYNLTTVLLEQVNQNCNEYRQVSCRSHAADLQILQNFAPTEQAVNFDEGTSDLAIHDAKLIMRLINSLMCYETNNPATAFKNPVLSNNLR